MSTCKQSIACLLNTYMTRDSPNILTILSSVTFLGASVWFIDLNLSQAVAPYLYCIPVSAMQEVKTADSKLSKSSLCLLKCESSQCEESFCCKAMEEDQNRSSEQTPEVVISLSFCIC